jgi:hypothetical protein
MRAGAHRFQRRLSRRRIHRNGQEIRVPGSSWVAEEENQATQTDFQGDVSTKKWDTYWQDWHKVQDAAKDA